MRAILGRAALPLLILALLGLGLRFITDAWWTTLPPVTRLTFIGLVLALLGLALVAAALAPDRTPHRNLVAWGAVAASIGGVIILDKDHADWRYQQVWGAAPDLSAATFTFGDATRLSDGSIVLDRKFDGHFYIDADINGAVITFLVDTGATGVALSLEDARQAGIRTDRLDYSLQTRTAAGLSRAAPVTIRSLNLAGRRFDNVPAHVLTGGDQSLLGMSVLERFESIEIRRDQLILRS
ncbi:retropepsin-like aspartic protease family protein [Maricaulis sp. CAU 1757]